MTPTASPGPWSSSTTETLTYRRPHPPRRSRHDRLKRLHLRRRDHYPPGVRAELAALRAAHPTDTNGATP